MTKVAIFSDIHGNLNALKAFYSDSKKNGADDYWFLGDLFGPGPDTQELLEAFKEIEPSVKIRGNWEDFLINSVHNDDKELPDSIRIIESYVTNHLQNPKEISENISNWPLHQEKTINGVRIGLSHNLPDNNSNDTLSIRSESHELVELFQGPRQTLDIAIYAHIHHPTMRYIDLNCLMPNAKDYNYSQADERLVLNIGSVGLPFDKPTHLYKERRAEYLLLEIGEGGDVYPHFRRIPYDNSLEFKKASEKKLPFKERYKNSFNL
ncbi:metallophosphoesterase [Lentilactobacillus fungorum]|uniref:Metallophosphoesterase n=1 Tax=Lentilactobacillus fungorum TaxID=2201250 RepID=A0ABQ3W210_9LACO|nr:metallophosphoesterase family protein [Lentilactobacillus fungorum]GHP14321.1 metallophosphoesterase [Lentilactobacillus fungorum]